MVLVWPVAHVLGGAWGEIIGAAVEAVGLSVVGLCLLRTGPGFNAGMFAAPHVEPGPTRVEEPAAGLEPA